jgi:hypothetical protein
MIASVIVVLHEVGDGPFDLPRRVIVLELTTFLSERWYPRMAWFL